MISSFPKLPDMLKLLTFATVLEKGWNEKIRVNWDGMLSGIGRAGAKEEFYV